MINSGIYDYIDVMNKAADAAWLRETVISQNIAMGDTPGYKRQDVNFEGVLERELGKMKYVSLDEKVRDLNKGHMDHLEAPVYTDIENYSYRLDENSVDPEQEYAELASTRIRYNALVDSMTSEFNKIKSVIK
ncbi:flagellar basal-body rod protein FlgB [Eubacterium sp. 14-2]|uniref:flagellar basal body rod protein FlgB n=1 Tax=Eubacterium sp. 14-2 TaxID=1235790 RepID=UPI00033CEAB3|nr:flagellar basal body rod protein FlgB [Eubacterium sp. 14-2]EOT26049.1 flagellar basal-body rod protein FlgB [Eubacterium sp. 14-2]